MTSLKKKTIHEVVTHNGEVVKERTFEVIDWSQYWVLDHEGNEKDGCTGFVFDKEDHPFIQNAKDALFAQFAEMQALREAEEAKGKEKRRQHRLEVKKAKEARNATHDG